MSKQFKESQEYISDFFGGLVVVWGLVLCTIAGPTCPSEYVWLILFGLSTVLGKNLYNGIKGGR